MDTSYKLIIPNVYNNKIEKNPKIITKYEPLAWVLFIALTAVVGCPLF